MPETLLDRLAQPAGQDRQNRLMQLAQSPGSATELARLQNMDLVAQSGGRALTGLLGGDSRSVDDKVREVLSKHNLQTTQGQQAAVAEIRQIPGAGAHAEVVRNRFVQENLEAQKLEVEQQKAQTGEDQLSRTDAITAVRNREAADAEARTQLDRERFQAEQQALTDGMTPAEYRDAYFSDLNREDWDQQSLAEAESIIAQSSSIPEMTNAMRNVRRKPLQGYKWERKILPGDSEASWIEYPDSSKAIGEWNIQVRDINTRNSAAKDGANRVLENVGRIRTSIEDPTVGTGFWGKALSLIPGTNEYRVQGDINSLKNQIGFTNLMEAKSTSSTGASGFGQLSNKELGLLTDLFAQLELGISKEALNERLSIIEKEFSRVRDNTRDDWTMDQVIGIEVKQARGEDEPRVTRVNF